jgi:hypothetical protein
MQQLKNGAGHIYATITSDKVNRLAEDVWTGVFGTQENLKAGLQAVVDIIEGDQCIKWLSDLSQIQGSFDSSKSWISDYVMPRVIRAGLKYQAMVIPKNIFAKLSTQDTIKKINQFEIRQFSNRQEARAWLDSMN